MIITIYYIFNFFTSCLEKHQIDSKAFFKNWNEVVLCIKYKPMIYFGKYTIINNEENTQNQARF